MRLRSVGLKLSAALLVLVAGALAIVYVAVVPTLENRLVDGRLNQLERTTRAIRADLDRHDRVEWEGRVLAHSQLRGVRVTVYEVLSTTSPVFALAIIDSRQIGQSDAQDPIVHRAAERDAFARGVIERGDSQVAEVAAPFGGAYVLLVSSPLDDTLENVSLVERRLLVAGVVALVAAALVGFLLARVFSRRIHRLERAADRIARGDFDEPVVDRSADELGQLAIGFDRMRTRLAALERARREFIANASHELRTPIFALGGHVELLADEDMDERTRREFLEEMRVQVERLTKLATDLLDLSRLDAGRLHVERAPVDLAEVASSLAAEFGVVARGSDHDVVSDAEDGVVALADEERVRQIGRILVENALVHTPAGTAVRLITRNDGDGAALVVEDDGPGIPAGDQDEVFERFYRSDSTVAAGSGLGLAIARELATVMGGEIQLESRPGRTVFTLRLPRSHERAAEREPALA